MATWEAFEAHAARMWAAEEENARRYAKRANLNLTVIAAFLGLGAFRFLTEPFQPRWASIVSAVLFILGLVVLGFAALFLLGLKRPEAFDTFPDWPGAEPQRDPAPTMDASVRLRFGEDDLAGLEPPSREDEGFDQYAVFLRTYEAALELGEQNARERLRMDVAQQLILIGFALIFLAISVHAIADAIVGVPHGSLHGQGS